MTHVINWVEIPATDFERAARFYENVFDLTLNRIESNGRRMGIFPYDAPATGGCVCDVAKTQPGERGPLIYLDARADIETVLSNVEAHGGHIAVGCTHISDEIGDIGVFIDTEGNRIAFHASA